MTDRPTFAASANQTFREYTAQASNLARTLALSGIAIIWLFAGGLVAGNASPRATLDRVYGEQALQVALLLLVSVLILDIAQYLWAAVIFGMLAWSADRIVAARDRTPTQLTHADRLAWRVARSSGMQQRIGPASATDAEASAAWRQQRTASAATLAASEDPASLLGAPAAPRGAVMAVDVLFWLKLLALLVAYVSLLIYLL